MGSPIAHGVDQALRRARRGKQSPPRPASSGTAWFYFVVATTCLSWLTAAVIGGPWFDEDDPLARRLLWAALYYAAVMGWPPLVGAWFARLVRDERKRTPAGVRLPRVRELAVALVLAVGLAVLSMLVARLFGEPTGRSGSDLMSRDAAVAIAGAIVVLLVQAFTEELGWRGFPLTCAVDRWGERGGLIVHGLAWGIWYAPLFLVSGGTPQESIPIAAGFAITCLLLGVVFGWLRLWSGSVFPSMIANAVLTIVAGLPLLAAVGGARDAVFRWPGWIVIGGVALVLLVWRRHDLTRSSQK
jgi:membrane protease YdiL (CAAX protease family)